MYKSKVYSLVQKEKEYVRADVGVHVFNFSSPESGAGTPL